MQLRPESTSTKWKSLTSLFYLSLPQAIITCVEIFKDFRRVRFHTFRLHSGRSSIYKLNKTSALGQDKQRPSRKLWLVASGSMVSEKVSLVFTASWWLHSHCNCLLRSRTFEQRGGFVSSKNLNFTLLWLCRGFLLFELLFLLKRPEKGPTRVFDRLSRSVREPSS